METELEALSSDIAAARAGAARRLGSSMTLDARSGTLQLTIRPGEYRAHRADRVGRPEPSHARIVPFAEPTAASAVGFDF
jgi:hypothetical protein